MTIFILKLLAAIAMLLDHIALFFPDLPVSLPFHWIGRIAAPIFIFGIVNGLKHTHSKRTYLIRLYLSSIAMSIIQVFTEIPLNFFRTLFVIACIICILEKTRENSSFPTHKVLFFYLLYQVFSCAFCAELLANSTMAQESICYYALPAILGNVFILEGGVVYIILGIFMYLFWSDKKKFSISYIGFTLFHTLCSATELIPIITWRIIVRIPFVGYRIAEFLDYLLSTIVGFESQTVGGNLLTERYQWMMILSLPFILCYNGKQGKKWKYSFYLFYPVHIVLLWSLATYTKIF